MRPQEGLFHSPGAYSGVAVLRLVRNAARTHLREVLSALHAELSANSALHSVLALEPALLPEAPPVDPAPLPLEGRTTRFPSTQAQVLLQVAATGREPLLWALRRTTALCAGVLSLQEEVLGGRIGEGREPFGFRDGLRTPSCEEIQRHAIVASGPLAGASWLLYLRFLQDLQRFARLRPHAQERVIGRTRDGEALPLPPAGAHVVRARAGAGENRLLIRRGFPFRHHGEEGLAFLSATAEPGHHRRSLEALLGQGDTPPDALLRYATAVGGGLYLAPPHDWFHPPPRQEASP
ncbi:MAG TPA: hypothetical protein VLQ93_23410 [Myxococcaceae bacterium]|nr:hypothetical protein [Myxococcaceae bacterium]